MTFPNKDLDAKSIPWTKKVFHRKKSTFENAILFCLLAFIILSAGTVDCAAAGANVADQALNMVASLPGGAAAAPRKSDIEEVAQATIYSVRNITDLMRQAHAVSIMLPSNPEKTQALPKSNADAAMLVAARLPELPIPARNAAMESVAVGTRLAVPGAQGLIWPVDGLIYSAFNASRGRRAHGAIDIIAKKGTPIAAAADGIVSVVANGGRNYSGYGKIVILDHGGGLFTLYAHNDSNLVKMGQRVRQGEYIATVGRTGRATTDHVHFEVRVAGVKHDPIAYLPSRPEVIRATNYQSGRR